MKVYSIILLIKILLISSENNNCFEYSCEECSSNNYGKCIKCKNGFTLIDGTCPCFNLNCALCENGYPELDSCLLCKNDYYTYYNFIDNKNNCKCKIDKCKICLNNICIKCEDNYYYDNITKSCIFQKCDDINCEICPSNEKYNCIKCKNNYYLKEGKCHKIPSFLKCNNIPGYYENNNNCELICGGFECNTKINNNEKLCDNKCFKCISNKLIFIENCNNTLYCNIKGCSICLNKNECYQCNRGYYKKENKCNKCINGCSYCINSEDCEYCLSGFKLTKEKKCKFTNKLDFNVTLYNIRKQNLIKIDISKESNITINLSEISNFNKYIPNCELYDENKGKCIKYGNYFSLLKNKFKSYILNKRNLERKKNISNCLEYTDEYYSSCKKCIPGYYIFNGLCLQDCPSLCLECSNDKYCLECSNLAENIEGRCYYTNCLKFGECEYCNEKHCKKCLSDEHFKDTNFCEKNFSDLGTGIVIGLSIGFTIILSIFLTLRCKKSRYSARIRQFFSYNRNYNSPSNFRTNNNNNDNNNNNNNIHNHINPLQIRVNNNNINNNAITNSEPNRVLLSENKSLNFEKEFEKQKAKLEKEYDYCDYCKFNPAKYKSDCGCLLCKKHIKQRDGKICINCSKEVNKIEFINECNICFEKKEDLGRFKCGCSFKVCKDCYIKCKKSNIKCPGCRRKI